MTKGYIEEAKKYIPNIADVRKLQAKFDSDLNTMEWSAKKDLETYLCALAYGSMGTELFYDEKIAYRLDKATKNNDEFMQGMLTYSVLNKMHIARQMLGSFEFEKNGTLNLEQFDKINDYATIAFILYYARTQGYKVKWDEMSHAYTPINLENGDVLFEKAEKLDPEMLWDNVTEQMYGKRL